MARRRPQLERIDPIAVSIQREAFTRLAVPYTDTAIGTTTRQDTIVVRQTHDTLRVSFQRA